MGSEQRRKTGGELICPDCGGAKMEEDRDLDEIVCIGCGAVLNSPTPPVVMELKANGVVLDIDQEKAYLIENQVGETNRNQEAKAMRSNGDAGK